MSTIPESGRFDFFTNAEFAQLHDALGTLDVSLQEKMMGAIAYVGAVSGELNGLHGVNVNRDVYSKRFVAKAERYGFMHEDDKYNELEQKAQEGLNRYYGVDTTVTSGFVSMVLDEACRVVINGRVTPQPAKNNQST